MSVYYVVIAEAIRVCYDTLKRRKKMKNKPLMIIGYMFAGIGILLWLVFTIINITVIGNHNLNLDLPTGMALLGIVAVVLSYILPSKHEK